MLKPRGTRAQGTLRQTNVAKNEGRSGRAELAWDPRVRERASTRRACGRSGDGDRRAGVRRCALDIAKVSKGVVGPCRYRETSGDAKERHAGHLCHHLSNRSFQLEQTARKERNELSEPTPSASYSGCRTPANISIARARRHRADTDAGCFLRTGGLRAADVRIAGPWGPARGALGRAHLQSATHLMRARRRHRLLETEDGGDACRGALRGE